MRLSPMSLSAFLALLSCLAASAAAHCGPGDPTGRYEGEIDSIEAGSLDVVLNLRCADGAYAGVLITPVGKFPITDGAFATNSLHLNFDGGGAPGAIDLAGDGDQWRGSFTLQDDHGPVTLERVGDAAESDSFDPTMAITGPQWREDLAYFAREIAKRHANAFHRVSRQAFEAAVARLGARIGDLNEDEIYVELDRLATMIGDGHTFVQFPPDEANLPIDIARFDGRYRVIGVAPGYEPMLGASLVAVGGTPVAEARRRLIEITPRDETQALREDRVESFLTIGMMMVHGAHIAPSRDKIAYTLRDDKGKRFTTTVVATAPDAKIDWKRVYPKAPLYLQHSGESFWCDTPAPKVVYCAFRGYRGLEAHAKEMLALIEKTVPDKLIIDMRNNFGGDFNDGLKYVIDPIAQNAALNRKGHLFVLMNEAIFSAGMSNTAQFRTRTNAILVGEPIGERPNTYQEPRELMLPNSHLIVRYSTKFYHFVDKGPNIVAPDKLIKTRWDDYKNGRDPVLEWALSR